MSAEDCPLAQLIERLYWRKPTLKLGEAVAIYDPEPTLSQITVKVKNRHEGDTMVF
jgi:hypothetical protein